MAKVFTQEEREKIKGLIVEFVRLNGRGTIRQLSDEIGVSHTSVGRLCMELPPVVMFTIPVTEYSRLSRRARTGKTPAKKLSRAKLKKPSVVDPDLIWLLPDGEIRRYDRRQNIICRECRKSEVMQRVLAFYQGNFQEVAQ